MPVIARIGSIRIVMHLREHNPPHFHAQYGGEEAQITIDPLEVHEGGIPKRQLGKVMEWAAEHQEHLAGAWARVEAGELPGEIG